MEVGHLYNEPPRLGVRYVEACGVEAVDDLLLVVDMEEVAAQKLEEGGGRREEGGDTR